MFSQKKNRYIFAKEKKSKKVARFLGFVLVVVLIVLAGLFVYFNFFGTASKVHLVDPVQVEIGSEAVASDLIASIDDGGVLSQDASIDTTKLGVQTVTVMLSFDGSESEYTFEVTVADTTPPVIQAPALTYLITGSQTDLITQMGVIDNSGETPELQVTGEYDASVPGDYPLTVTATDSSGNEGTATTTLRVVDMASAPNNLTYTTATGHTLLIKDQMATCDGVLMVNKTFSLPADFAPGLTAETYTNYTQMRDAAEKDGIYLYTQYGYRSYYAQEGVFWTAANQDATKAETTQPRAGFSEHQSGLALDLNSEDVAFGDTNEGKWLAAHCWEYGFIMRYPKGADSFTGYSYMPWHVRYVGKDLAKILYNDGNWLSLEEYFGLPSQYPAAVVTAPTGQ